MANVTIVKGISVPADKHEVVLNGPQVTKAIEEYGILEGFYGLKQVNYVSINAGLTDLSPKFGLLSSLTSLVLHGNKLKTIPPEIGKLLKLKHLDVSSNSLTGIPDDLNQLSQLSSLNLSVNCLTSLPSFRQNVKMSSLNVSCNRLNKFPDCCYMDLTLLSELLLQSNEILCIPNEINKLHSLKTLDIGSNKISEVPPEISHLIKLKELNLKDNPIKDKRLKKMIEQCHSKKVIDYIRHNVGKQTGCHAERKESLRLSFSEDKENKTVEPVSKPRFVVQVLNMPYRSVEIFVSTSVKTVRAGIMCCVVRNVSFTSENFQKFIHLQNKFHDTVCERRHKATIGTHDLKSIKSPLKYTAKAPENISFIPLGSSEICSASEFVARKKLESENLKKEKKRNWNAGLYQFLPMLEGYKEYPFLIDAEDKVISLPPITNSEISKISVNTKDMLIEVTSNTDKKLIREIMDKFVKEIAHLGIGTPWESSLSDGDKDISDGVEGIAVIEPVILYPEKGPKFHYPTESDLHFPPSSPFMKSFIEP